MRGRSLDDLWEAAPESEGGRLFVVWLTPFRDRQAREALFEKIVGLSNDRTLLPVFSRGLLLTPGDDATRVNTARCGAAAIEHCARDASLPQYRRRLCHSASDGQGPPGRACRFRRRFED